VFTSATRRITDLMLAGTGLSAYFAAVVTDDEVANPKPAPDGLLSTCRLLDIPASAAAYVGDADTDLYCARAAGAMALHARWSSHTDTVPGFPYVAHRPGDVITLIAASNAHHA
jgi:phosphoglycolate phosphatase-like HAD superfamily hydrolase